MSFFEELKRRNVFRVGIAYGVAAWLLIQIADTVFPRIGLSDSAVTLVIALLAIGFVPAIIFAWAFEMTPEGLKRERDVERAESIMPQTGKKLDRVIILGLVAVIVVMGVERAWFAGRDDAAPETVAEEPALPAVEQAKTIAVLPFADLSESQDQQWFSDGLAEEILNALARAPDLLVSSRTSSFAYKGSNTPIAQIASELGVAHVLEGSVRRAGDRIRVTAQLIRAADGFHVWSENYDRSADDVIALQEELAVSIARALKTTMDPEALAEMLRAGTRSVEAYEHYLNGLGLSARSWEEGGWDSFVKGYEEFERARGIDPGFPYAHYYAAIFWFNQISISRRPSGLVSASPAEKMEAFRARIGPAIETAGNETDRMKFEALLAQVEARYRDAIALSLQVLEQRPFDFDNVERLLEAGQDVHDLETQLKVFRHAHGLWQNGPEWLRAALSATWRLTFSGGDTGIDEVAWIVDAMRQSRKPSPAYQAHRALLWFGATDEAREMLPYLAGETGEARAIIDSRQACAEGRRSDAERILRSIPAHWTDELQASTKWHLHQMLGQPEKAAEVLKPFESAETPLTLTAYLGYPDFDPAPFPVVQTIMQREGIQRPPPVKVPFACPEQDLVQQESVAVLPFTAMSSGVDDEYFADGLTEEILNSLAQLPELLVTARTSSFHFKGQNIPVPEIGRTLGVDHVVEGSVRRAGDRVRITAQLVRAEDGFHLWSDTYDRTLEDVFAVQEDIATNIAETLDVVLDDSKLARMRKAGIRDVDAFIAFQKGQEAFVEAHGDMSDIAANLEVANRYFDQALAAAPNLIGARILKADAASHDLFDLASEIRPPAYPGEAEDVLEALRKEFRLAWESSSPGNQRDILDVELNVFADSWKGFSARMDRALLPDLVECAETNWTLEVANALGKGRQVIEKLRAELPCNPYNLLSNFALGFLLMWNGEPDAALAHTGQAESKGVSFSWMEDVVAFALLAKGEFDDPRVERVGGTRSWIRFPKEIIILAARGDVDKARGMAGAYLAGEHVDTWSAANVAAIVGDREAANRYAARIDAQPGGQLILANLVHVCACGAPFDLEATPNYKRRIEEGGFAWPPYTAIHFPGKDW